MLFAAVSASLQNGFAIMAWSWTGHPDHFALGRTTFCTVYGPGLPAFACGTAGPGAEESAPTDPRGRVGAERGLGTVMPAMAGGCATGAALKGVSGAPSLVATAAAGCKCAPVFLLLACSAFSSSSRAGSNVAIKSISHFPLSSFCFCSSDSISCAAARSSWSCSSGNICRLNFTSSGKERCLSRKLCKEDRSSSCASSSSTRLSATSIKSLHASEASSSSSSMVCCSSPSWFSFG
mmetsp:Transcript_46127/g.84507  ORF Transcript_46127/g.84507 Transcript_46127/m.84507 type:complete len:236 (-) Transcript_46127:142-849(-)